jgi:hydroxyacylglutathione hydrolase
MPPPVLPLEDELGDVLEKAMRGRGMTVFALGERAGVAPGRIRDAIDYRPDFTSDELRRIAVVLGLNEVGLCALGAGQYPQPEMETLPFCVWPLRMPHGIGVTNAYLVGECGGTRAVLFDTGRGIDALARVWPSSIRQLDAVFLTHSEPEHAGAFCDVVARFGAPPAYIPKGAAVPCGDPISEGETRRFGSCEVTAFETPGHAAAHNCYLVRSPYACRGAAVLIAGDLVFAGSVGGAYFSQVQLQANLRRMFSLVPANTMIAPGHGPLTTVAIEQRYNPFFR